LEALKKRIVPEECVGEIALNEFSLRRTRWKIVNENNAQLSSAEKIDSQLKRAEIFRAVD
jgi:hypothetical protein